MPGSITTLKQIHSAEVRNATGLRDRGVEGDALVSIEPELLIGIRTADCVPILLADTETHSVAAIHAGWRGTAAGVAAETVHRMRVEFGTKPDNLHAAIGPAIRACCYEVGSEVARQFSSVFPEWGPQGLQRERTMLDLAEANRRLLRSAGILNEQIYDSELCTCCCAADFYSYRRDPTDRGRLVSFISRKQ